MRLVTTILWLFLPANLFAGDQALALPAEWHGVWVGQLTVHTVTGKSFNRPMEIQIEPIADSKSVTWKITSSFNDRQSVRNYELVPYPEQQGLFKIDEKNGILIDARLFGQTLYSYFQDNEMLTNVKYELRGDSVHVEMASVSLKDPKLTSLKDPAIEIRSFGVRSVQVGELKKKR